MFRYARKKIAAAIGGDPAVRPEKLKLVAVSLDGAGSGGGVVKLGDDAAGAEYYHILLDFLLFITR
jgi:hypothetical protein